MRNRWRILLALAIWPMAGLSLAADSNPLPGMPPVVDPKDIYSETQAGKLSPTVRSFPDLIYVPNSDSNTVDVIDPRTYRIVNHFKVETTAATCYAFVRFEDTLGFERSGR